MPVDGGGNISRPSSPIPVTGQTAEAPQVNVPLDDIYSIMNLFPFLDGRKAWRGNQNLNGYKMGGAANGTAPQDYVTLSQLQSAYAIFPGFLQVDTISSASPPPGWIFANGLEVSRSTYSALWSRVSTGNNLAATQAAKTHGQYGPGNGTTTFTLPNLYADGGYFIRPITAGRAIGNIQVDDLKAHVHDGITSEDTHTHNYSDFFVGESGGGVQSGAGRDLFASRNGETGQNTHRHAFSTNPTGGSETRPKNIAYPVLIKT